MSMSANIHRVTQLTAVKLESYATLRIASENGNNVSAFMPLHAAQAAADAYTRAMQAKQDGRGGFTYQSADELWLIKNDYGWRAQSDEVTGDGDPTHLFAEADSLLALLDEIDRTVSERETPICKRAKVTA